MPSDTQVNKALELIQKGAGNYDYFFEKLADPAWIEPLAKRQRFRHPPSTEHVSGTMYRYPPWPEGEYLLRMAELAPDSVAAAVESACFESDNPRVHIVLMEIAAKLPAKFAKVFATHETEWVRKQRSLFALYPEKAASLVEHLVKVGKSITAVNLTSAMLQVEAPDKTPEGQIIEGSDGGSSLWRPAPDPQGKMESVWTRVFLGRVLEPLILSAPRPVLSRLAENVNRAVTIHSSHYSASSGDLSTSWRPQLEHGSAFAALDDAVTALVDAIKFLCEHDEACTHTVMAALEPYKWPIFDRLRAFALLHAKNPTIEEITDFVNVDARYSHFSSNPEFVELLKERAQDLPKPVLKAILKRLDAGPNLEIYAYHLKHRVPPEHVEAEKQTLVDQWKLNWLLPLADVLDEGKTQELKRLIEKYDTPRPRRHRVFGGAVRTEISPVGVAAFNEMSIADLVRYLRDWTPPVAELPFLKPSRAGVAGTLREWVADDPQRATRTLEDFLTTELDPVYITAILDEFSNLLKSDKEIDVYAVAHAVQWVAENTNALTELEGEQGFGLEATWNWAHMSAARFMADLFLNEKRLDIARSGELFPAVRSLCYVPRPTVDDEEGYRKEPKRHVSFALNTPRPVGVEAMIRYGRWVKLAIPETDSLPEKLRPVLEVLEDKLNAEREQSVAVREMFGMQFQVLAWLDLEWFISIIPRLFPGKEGKIKGERTLDRFGWSSYLHYGGPVGDTLPATRKRYELAVRALQKGQSTVQELDRTMAGHLMQYYAHGAIELDDPLMEQFFASANVKLRGQALSDIGWSLGHQTDQLMPEMQTRLMRLWESRMSLLHHSGSEAEAEELTVFGWWLGSKKFPDDWVIAQTMSIVEELRSLQPDFQVAEAMERLSEEYPYEAVRTLHVLFEEDRDGWAIHGWNQHLDVILKRAFDNDGQARKEAERMIDLLVSKGFRSYRSLLSPS